MGLGVSPPDGRLLESEEKPSSFLLCSSLWLTCDNIFDQHYSDYLLKPDLRDVNGRQINIRMERCHGVWCLSGSLPHLAKEIEIEMTRIYVIIVYITSFYATVEMQVGK